MTLKRWTWPVAAAATGMMCACCLAQSGITKTQAIGPVDVTASSWAYHSGVMTYKDAHLVGSNGLTIDADTVDITVATKTAQLTGDVKAHLATPQSSQGIEDMTVYADKAVYDRAANRVDLSGDVKCILYSVYTDGPLVQTGDSAVMQLGPPPDFPVVTMEHVHTTFTPGH